MIISAALEPSGVTDAIESTPIFVSTTARMMYRRLNPSWQKAPNKDLNSQIAKQFSEATHQDFFHPKKGPQNVLGEIRVGAGAKFIALLHQSQIFVIAVKGNPKINVPAPVKLPNKQPQVPADVQMADDHWSKNKKNFLEQHAIDIYSEMNSLDSDSSQALREKALGSGNVIKYLRSLSGQGSQTLSGFIGAGDGDRNFGSVPENAANQRGSAYSVKEPLPI